MHDLSEEPLGFRSSNCVQGCRRMLQSAAAAVGVSFLGFESNRALRASRGSNGGTGSGEPEERSHGTATPPFTNKMMGFMLPHEQFPLTQLLEFGEAAEKAGFDLLATSDHLQPWQSNEGHSGMAWVTMAALGQHTKRAWMGPTVTCPTFRYHPAVVAEGFASLDLLYPGRVFLGLGSGEALNEQAAVGSWPNWQERSDRLVEATQIIRELWKGQQVSHKGKYYEVNARLYDPPQKPVPLLMAANGPKAMRRAGEHADGLVTDPKTWKQYRSEFEKGAKAAGKDLSKLPVLVESICCRRRPERSARGGRTLALWTESIQGILQRSGPANDSTARRCRSTAGQSLRRVAGRNGPEYAPQDHHRAIPKRSDDRQHPFRTGRPEKGHPLLRQRGTSTTAQYLIAAEPRRKSGVDGRTRWV
jgi:G6PDH family F420-dependent oxidoreductase